VGEDAAEPVLLHLAHERRPRPETRHPHDGVGGRAARDFNRRAHGVVDRGRPGLVDQRHGALAHAMPDQEVVLGARDHVDNGIANADNVGAKRVHEVSV
jgi:hypothetical protein